MRIVHIVPGFGGTFYCGNCLRDSVFMGSLKEAGHKATMLPMYLPLTMDGDDDRSDTPVFYGAVNIYLKQQFPLFRHMPGWMEHLFDSRPLLKLAARKSGSTRAHGLEELTESMLLGKDGNQSRELEQLVNFLKHHEKPDVVHFSNALLLGMAKQIREEVNVPVVFSLQDEDVWIDAMDPSWHTKLWNLMAEQAKAADAFVAVSDYFAGTMKEKLNIPAEKLHVVPIGIKPENYNYALPASDTMAIGYLSRICEENGFEILVDAFIRLKQNPAFHDLRLVATGGMTGDDKQFIQKQLNKIEELGFKHDVVILQDFTPGALQRFFRSITLLSVPVLKGEAFGLYQIESLASGIPLVQPALGAFPEIIQATGGGVVYHPNTPDKLAEALAELLTDRNRIELLSHTGRRSVEEHFDCRKLTGKMISIYEKLTR